MKLVRIIPWLLAATVVLPSCFARVWTSPFRAPHPAPMTLPKNIVRSDARIAVSWIGHATALVQLDDKLVLTDPVFTQTVGLFSRRTTTVPMDPNDLPPIDAVLVSHMHFDHLSLGSLEKIEDKVRRLYVPEGGLVYLTDFSFDAVDLARWESVDDGGGLVITAVPVRHNGMRYGIDNAWMDAFTGYVVRYHGLTVYFGGDTGYDSADFIETHKRFGKIDVALLPIAPIHPRGFMRRSHLEPYEALLAMNDLGADRMIPVHFDTFVNSSDEPNEALDSMRRAMRMKELDETRVCILQIGEQRTIVPR